MTNWGGSGDGHQRKEKKRWEQRKKKTERPKKQKMDEQSKKKDRKKGMGRKKPGRYTLVAQKLEKKQKQRGQDVGGSQQQNRRKK